MGKLEFIHGDVTSSTLSAVLEDAKDIVIVSGYVTRAGFEHVAPALRDCTSRVSELMKPRKSEPAASRG
jgi:hypothetical protein